MLIEIIFRQARDNIWSLACWIAIILILVYFVKEWNSAYGYNNLGQKIATSVENERECIPYNRRDCSQDKFTRGKSLSQENKRRYGDIYIQRSGTCKEVVLTTPNQLAVFYKSKSGSHKKLDSFGAGAFLVSLLGKCLGFQNGPEWLTMRKTFDPFFTHKAALESLPLIIEYISRWCDSLEHDCPVDVDPLKLISEVPFTCIAKYLYGNELATDSLLETLKSLMSGHTELMHFSFLSVCGRFKAFQYLPFRQVRQLSAFQNEFFKLTLQQVNLAKSLGEYTVVQQLYECVDGTNFTLDNWIQSIDEILFANVDVTGTIMAWALVEMASNCDEQKRLREEIIEHTAMDFSECKGSKNININDYVKRSDTFLHMCVLEILRLHPLLWFSFPESTLDTLLIDGFKILPDSPIVIDQYQINYNAPLWNPPDKHNGYGGEFHPSRFENISARDSLYSQVTFGPGARKCLGKNFAQILIKTELVHILKIFEISMLKEVKYSKNTFIVQPVVTLRLSPLID